jgi:diketogulonate reductase-like aldo/keto reductase
MSLHLDIDNPKTEAKLTAAAHRRGIAIEALIELAVDRLPPIEEPQLQELGDFDGRSVADMILQIGTVKGGITDLATNPMHMEGFGTNHAKSRTV